MLCVGGHHEPLVLRDGQGDLDAGPTEGLGLLVEVAQGDAHGAAIVDGVVEVGGELLYCGDLDDEIDLKV